MSPSASPTKTPGSTPHLKTRGRPRNPAYKKSIIRRELACLFLKSMVEAGLDPTMTYDL